MDPRSPNHSLLAVPVFLSAPYLLGQRNKRSFQSHTFSLTAAEQGKLKFTSSSPWRPTFPCVLTVCDFKTTESGLRAASCCCAASQVSAVHPVWTFHVLSQGSCTLPLSCNLYLCIKKGRSRSFSSLSTQGSLSKAKLQQDCLWSTMEDPHSQYPAWILTGHCWASRGRRPTQALLQGVQALYADGIRACSVSPQPSMDLYSMDLMWQSFESTWCSN